MAQDRIDPNAIRWQNSPAETREVRSEEADIGQRQASAERTRTLTPLQQRELELRNAREEATLPAAQRQAVATADRTELQNEQLRRLLAASEQAGSGRLYGDDLAAAETELRTTIGNLLQVRRLSRDMFSASGFGHNFVNDYWPGGSPAQDVSALLAQIGSFTALGKLMELKSDPRNETGGVLGAINTEELRMLRSSAGNLDPSSSDAEFQAGVDDVLAKALGAYSALGGDPYAIAEEFRPDEIEQFAPLLRSWRALPEDEQTILRYINTARADGTYDPSTYAQLQAEAYARATGRPADQTFIANAMNEGAGLLQQEGAVQALDYSGADEAVRQQAVRRTYAQDRPEADVSGMIGDAAINLIPSTFQMAADTVQSLTVDLPDTLAGVASIVAGASGISEDDSAWQATKDYFTTRYGTRDGLANAIRTDPAGVLADVSGVMTLGGTTAAKTLGRAGQLSRIGALSNAARAAEGFTSFASRLDPLRIAAGVTQRGVNLAGRTGRMLGTEIPARIAGAPAGAVEQAVSAGRRGSTAFTEQLEGAPTATSPVDQLDRAVSELYDRRSLEYQDARNRLNLNETVPFTEIDRALLDTQSVGRYRDIDYRRAPEAWQAANEIIENFRSRGYDTVEAVDAMKQQLGGLRDSFPLGSAERGVVQDIYNGVRGAITTAAPEYAKVMEDYAAASDALTDIRATLATSAAGPDTTLRRLQQQVAGTGPRGRTVLDILEGTQSGRGLGDAVAGMTLSSNRPAGLTSSLAPTAAVAGSPEALLALAATPQALGREAYGLGEMYGRGERAVGRVVNAPIAGGRSLADLTRDYGVVDAMLPNSRFSQGLRVANPALIQPQVNPVAVPTESDLTDEERQLLLSQPQRYLPPSTVEGPAPSAMSIDALARQYGTAPAPAPVSSSAIDDLAARYSDQPSTATPTAAAPAVVPSTAQTGVVNINGRPARYDEATDRFLDVETGAPVDEGYKHGGRVKRHPVPTRATRR